jgi:hypothetical protein
MREYQRIESGTATLGTLRRVSLFHLLNERRARANGSVYFLAVIVIVAQGRIYLAECQSILGRDLINTLAHTLMPDRYILYADTVTLDMRFPAEQTGGYDNVFGNDIDRHGDASWFVIA